MAKEPFTVAISDQTLRDLKERLRRTRFAPDFANDGWQYGTNLDYLKRLVEYWIDGYDWRRAEREVARRLDLSPASEQRLAEFRVRCSQRYVDTAFPRVHIA